MSNLITPSEIPIKSYDLLQGNYRLGKDVFIGPYYRVTKALFRPTDEKRIIRTYRKFHMSEYFHERFLSELSALLRLDHFHFCEVHEYFQDSEAYYIISARAKGENLITRLKASPKILTEALCASYMQQIFSILVHLQELNIVHRELTPENLYFASKDSNTLKLVKFDLCKILNPGELLTEVVGYTRIISPEMLSGNYDYSCDMWSAGIIMHVLLVGILPFKAKDETSILKAISSGRVGFNRPIWKRISVQAKDLIQKILVVNPALRISPSEALAHPWLELTSNSPPAKERAVRCFSNISAFKAKEKWKKAIYRYIAAHFSASKDEECVTKLFRYLDTNHDGMLSREELKEGTLKLFGTKVRTLMRKLIKY